MARKRADMQMLIDQRDQLLKEVEALKNKVAGIEMAISLLDTGASYPSIGRRSAKSVKTVLLDLLQEVGTTGLSPATAIEMANRRGVTLNAGSVGSTLSRFKREGIVALDGDKYKLPQFVTLNSESVVPLWRQPPPAASQF
jgi:hypothetical protein